MANAVKTASWAALVPWSGVQGAPDFTGQINNLLSAQSDLGGQISGVVTTLDGKNHVYYQATAPTSSSNPAPVEGDLWFDTSNLLSVSRYTSGSWVSVNSQGVATQGGGQAATPFYVEDGQLFIESAVINQVAAGSIIAGLVTVALALASPILGSVAECFRPDYGTGSTAPPIAVLTADGGPGLGLTTQVIGPLLTFTGWANTSGFAANGFCADGDQIFELVMGGNFQFSGSSSNGTAQLVYRVNGGTWTPFGNYSACFASGTFVCVGTLPIDLQSTDIIDFGLNFTTTESTLDSYNVTGKAFNI
jgi:hypothetical protein